ncbi:MAG: NAD(+) synthase [candidate division FCPU426 bacterium]
MTAVDGQTTESTEQPVSTQEPGFVQDPESVLEPESEPEPEPTPEIAETMPAEASAVAAMEPAVAPAIEPTHRPAAAQASEPRAESAGSIPAWFESSRLEGDIKTLKFPGLDSGQARASLIQFIQEQMERAGVRNVVLGLSGGLDSAVAANLLVEALGRERVHMVFYAEGERSNQDRGRAGLVARFLKSPLDIHDLRPVLHAGMPDWERLSSSERQPQVARLRAAYLYHQAQHRKALVAGSVNKTKCWVGGLGRHAELACDFNLLGDLYQSQVLELARALNVPRVVTDHAQQPGNGRTTVRAWKEIDYYLYQVLDVRVSLSHLQRLGVHEEKLRWVYHRIRESAGLRQPAPIPDNQRAYVPRGGTF